MKHKLIHKWGVRDVEYYVIKTAAISGKQKRVWICPYYDDWNSMVIRCHNVKCQERQPTYIGCTIDEEWKYFSNFIKWVDQQPNRDWQNCSLDKDFLVEGNKHYGPDTCVYIPQKLNSFVVDAAAGRGSCMIGVADVYFKNKTNPYHAATSNPFTGKRERLGYFPTELEAHKAWQAKKHEYACQLADLQDDPRVADALRQRYAPDKDWSKR